MIGAEIDELRRATPHDPQINEAQKHSHALFLGTALRKNDNRHPQLGRPSESLLHPGHSKAAATISKIFIRWMTVRHYFTAPSRWRARLRGT